MRVPFARRRARDAPAARAYLAGAPLLIAHRGGSALAPENTLLAFRRAIEWWRADILELDVHATRDGEVVVLHDDTVDRTTDGRGAVAALTLAELRALDAGYRFTPDGGATFPFRGRGITIPTLREVLTEFPRARVNVEIKAGAAQAPLLRLLTDAGDPSRVLIAAGERGNRARFTHYPGPVSAAGSELKWFYGLHLARAARLFRPRVDAFQMPEWYGGRRVLTPRFVRDAHRLGLAVHVWTVDDEADMRRLLAWGVDGLITDRPDVAARVLHDRALRPLPPGPPANEAEPLLTSLPPLRAG